MYKLKRCTMLLKCFLRSRILFVCVLMISGCSTVEYYQKDGVSITQRQNDYEICSKKARKNAPTTTYAGVYTNVYGQYTGTYAGKTTCYSCISARRRTCMGAKGYVWTKDGNKVPTEAQSREIFMKNVR